MWKRLGISLRKLEITKETLHAKMGTIKDRNGMDLKEAEDIKKRWQEYTEELQKKDLNDPDNHDSVITHLVPDILECEVKWALGNITTNKASGGDGIPAELFQILKDDCVKSVALDMSANLENSAVATGLEKVSFYSSTKERQCQIIFRVTEKGSKVQFLFQPKERQCQRILKLPHSCAHLTR